MGDRDGAGACGQVRAEEEGLHEAYRQLDDDRDQGGDRQDRHLLDPRLVQAEDADEACHEGWQEGDLWQDDGGEGEAAEEEHLSRAKGILWARTTVSLASAASRGHSAEEAKPGGGREAVGGNLSTPGGHR